MRLNQLADNPGSHKRRRRLGRGLGSGRGKTAGRGQKGQKARSGVRVDGFEGGQMPLFRRLPKRGFTNIFRLRYVEINTGRLQKAIDDGRLNAGAPIDVNVLREAGVISHPRDGLRLLAKGDIKSAITIEVTGASQAAIDQVAKAGGKVNVIPVKVDAKREAMIEKRAASRLKRKGTTAKPAAKAADAEDAKPADKKAAKPPKPAAEKPAAKPAGDKQ